MKSSLAIAVALWTTVATAAVERWVWGGIPYSEVPAGTGALYLHQGTFRDRHVPQGLSPFPLHGRPVWLVFRLEALVAVKPLAEAINDDIARWESHRVDVAGVQIDFDSATARLGSYVDFLARLRAAIAKRYRLSVTGLADWSVATRMDGLTRLSGVVDEVVFQLYRGRSPIRDLEAYYAPLGRLHFPFKIGLLPTMRIPKAIARNELFKGAVIFQLSTRKKEGHP